MLKVIGFLLEFKNKASKGIEKVVKDTEVLNKVWKSGSKSMKGWTKAMGEHLDTLSAKAAKVFLEGRAGIFDFTNSLDRLEGVFGERIRSIVEHLLTPQAAIAGLGLTALKAGTSYEQVMRRISLETGATGENLRRFGKDAQELAFELGTGLGQTANVMGVLAARMDLADKQAIQLGEDAMRAARIGKMDVEEILGGMVKMNKVLGYTADEQRKILAGSVAAGRASARNLQEVLGSALEYTDLIRRVPKSWQKNVLPDIIQMGAAMGDVFLDSRPIIEKVLKGITEVTSEEFIDLKRIVAHGSAAAANELDKAWQEHDFQGAFRALVKAAQQMDDEQIKTFASTFQQLFGMDIGDIDALSKMKFEAMDKINERYKEAGKRADFLKRTDEDNLTITQRAWRTWERLLVVLIPIGEVLVSIGHGIMTVFDATLRFARWLMDIPVLGDLIKWAGVFSIVFVTLGAIVGLFKILLALAGALVVVATPMLLPFVLIAGAITAIIALVTYWKDIVSAIGVAIGWVGKMFLKLGELIYHAIIAPVGSFFGWIFRTLVVGAFDLAAAVLGEIREVIVGIGNVIAAVGEWIYNSIIKPVMDFLDAVWGTVKDIGDWIGGAASDVFHFVTLGAFEEAPGAASGGIVMPSPGGSLVNVAEGGQPEIIADPHLMRKIIGADDIIDAIWASTEYLVSQLTSPTAYTAPGYQPSYAAPATFETPLNSSQKYDR